jgi:hypothetical protein
VKNTVDAEASPDPPGEPLTAIVRLLSEVQPETVEWLWRDRIPLRKLTVLDGDPGLGKSTLTLDLAARLSRGAPMPDGTPGLFGGVVILTAEDGLADTIVPRLEAVGADRSRIVALEGVRLDDSEHTPTLPDDLPALTEAIAYVRARLVVVDPLVAFLGAAVDSWKDQSIRRALYPLAQLADYTGAAVVAVRHLTKGEGGQALYRGGGSIGIIGAARAGLLVARDPDDAQRRVLAVTKSNLGPEPCSLAFRLEAGPNGAARVAWEGTSPHGAGALLATPSDPETRSELERADDLLRELLADGPLATRELEQAAEAEGISRRTLQRARGRLKTVRQRDGFGPGGRWLVSLPTYTATHHKDRQGDGLAVLGGSDGIVSTSASQGEHTPPLGGRAAYAALERDAHPCAGCGGPTEPGAEVYREALCNACAVARGTAEVAAERVAIQSEGEAA